MQELTKFSYIGVLVFIIFGTVWLEIVLQARVLRKIKRLILTLIPVVTLYVIWDYYAIINIFVFQAYSVALYPVQLLFENNLETVYS